MSHLNAGVLLPPHLQPIWAGSVVRQLGRSIEAASQWIRRRGAMENLRRRCRGRVNSDLNQAIKSPVSGRVDGLPLVSCDRGQAVFSIVFRTLVNVNLR